LLEDWELRRKRLEHQAVPPEPYRRLQIRIFDYLIHRYRASPEAAGPARAPCRSDLFLDRRAIVVHHHVWRDKVGGVKNEREARQRVTSILRRMSTPTAQEESDEPPDFLIPDEPELTRAWQRAQVSGHAIGIRSAALLGVGVYGAIEAALRAAPYISERGVRYLYERIADIDAEEIRAVELLTQCENRSALKYAMVAWRARVEAGRIDQVTTGLEAYFCRPELRGRVGDRVRLRLADDHPRVRVRAIALLGAIGSLDDVGLLTDLLSLPPQDDEDPQERPALAQAIERIAAAE
jgi:hypothetical protein